MTVSFTPERSMYAMLSSCRRFWFPTAVLAGFGLSLFFASRPILSAAQEKPASETKKDDEQTKKPKPMREEQEESKTPAIKKPIKVDDEDVDVRHPKPAKLGVTQPADLEAEAQNAKYDAVKKLFHTLAVTRDVVNMKNGQTIKVDPIPEFIGARPDPEKKVNLQGYHDNGKAMTPQPDMPLKQISAIHPYEEIAL